MKPHKVSKSTGKMIKHVDKKRLLKTFGSLLGLILIVALGLFLIQQYNSTYPTEGIAGKAFADLTSEQKQGYWACYKGNGCGALLSTAQQTKNYATYRTCSKDCHAQALAQKPEDFYCIDSDGINYTNKGKVTSYFYPNGTEDYCLDINGKNYLFEGQCVNNKAQWVQKNCKEMENYECEGGLCKEKPYCLNDECKSSTLDFVIVTRPIFTNALNDFAFWKKNQFGYQVGIFTLEWINENYEGGNIADKVKIAINHLQKEKSVKFFLLVGDTEIEFENEYLTFNDLYESYNNIFNTNWNIPSMGYYTELGNFVISDLPYTSKIDFNDIASIISLQPVSEESDFPAYYSLMYSPEAYVGRWPVRTTEELNFVINKTKNAKKIHQFNILAYEDVVTTWKKCKSGKNLQCNYLYPTKEYPPEAEYEVEVTSEPLCKEFPKPTNMPNPCYDFWNTRWLLLNNIPQTLLISNMSSSEIAMLAKEQFLNTSKDAALYETFHGYYDFISIDGKEHTSEEQKYFYIKSADFDSFSNEFPLAVLESCSVFAFYKKGNAVFAEKMLSSNKGPVVVVKTDDYYHFLQFLLEGKTVGEAFYAPMPIKHTLYTENEQWLLGDPSLILYEK